MSVSYQCSLTLVGTQPPPSTYTLTLDLAHTTTTVQATHYHKKALTNGETWALDLTEYSGRVPENTSATIRVLCLEPATSKQSAEVEIGQARTLLRDLLRDVTSTLTVRDRDNTVQATLTLARDPTTKPPWVVFLPASATVDPVRFDDLPYYRHAERYRLAELPANGRHVSALRRTHTKYIDDVTSDEKTKKNLITPTTGTPVWAIVLLRQPAASRPVADDGFLRNALREAVYQTGQFDGRVDQWVTAVTRNDPGSADVLTQVLGWFPWSCIYAPDMTYDVSQRRRVLTDQFSTLFDKEDFAYAGGDCEDVSCTVLRLFEWISSRSISAYSDETDPDGGLRALIALAQCYCAFVVDVSIYNGGGIRLTTKPGDDRIEYGDSDTVLTAAAGVVPPPPGVQLHMCVHLVPWDIVCALINNGNTWLPDERADDRTAYTPIGDAVGHERIARSAQLPTLCVEATEPCRGDWSQDAVTSPPLAWFDAHTRGLRETLTTVCGGSIDDARGVWNKLRKHCSVAEYKHDQFYREMVCLYSSQLYDLCGYRHSWVPVVPPADSQSLPRVGVAADEWLTRLADTTTTDTAPPFGLIALPAATASDRKALASLTQRMPFQHAVTLTDSKRTEVSLAAHPGSVTLAARGIDWTARDDERWRAALAAQSSVFTLVRAARVPVTNTNEMMCYTVVPTKKKAT